MGLLTTSDGVPSGVPESSFSRLPRRVHCNVHADVKKLPLRCEVSREL